jgi:hypothetical protein
MATMHRHAQRYLPRSERGHRGGQRRDAGRDRNGHRQHVVDQQRGGGRERRVLADVVLGDEISAASLRVGRHRLAVGGDDDGQQGGDAERDRQ